MIDPKHAKVIVIEDNSDNLFLITSLLRTEVMASYINARASGYHFFRLLDSQPDLVPDLILLDIQIPTEDGYAVLKKIRQVARLRKAVVVAVTANTTAENVERAQAAGFDGFIGKPIDFHSFPDQIRRILSGERVWEPGG